ncbi:NAD(P)-dependent oxidoreductase [Mesorhizobium sp.]|uniref:NAD(P)-dependent oxidoreductase n=1 Tax=Mesorhizobium sp. TaxID=1871066 RepID=UPI000FEA3D2F|nr:NAD(P)-dependent oxidoreductase [Mesorhizobium sp.]RWM47235.1 MAG: NAD(P)-dependent oxidoreductase [Mesorhizobium sp.]RWM48290.1 MAG: NAD(P)-dependent oxidoreductase [Mesorhizobium sp.]RWM53041.1 MAG: NAD(P)-dependent oxidoreductase [Mesorhizobium sp.]TIO65162.1 MAG: NAD(P)-dependent oxidoreductase [Mesorhizobium sp.]TJV89675.1 MAG: NAD(P)-dependent oxidoreductase [Mesorhizobium sp.]
MSNQPVIGFIGLGLMGHGMAKNLLQGEYDLWVRGRSNRKPVESLLSIGAHEAASPKDMAERCDVIHICLSNSPQIEAVMRAPDGILAAARAGLVVIDASTADPSSTESLAAELAAMGGHFVDAPLGGTPAQAESGQLSAMVGCDEAVFDRIRPIIDCWASSATRIGPVGSGHKMKLLMNFIGLSYGALFSEVVVLGAKIGISPQIIREIIAPSRMGNGFFETFMSYVVDRNRESHKFTIANAAKDIRYLNNMASDANVVNIMAAAAKHYYTHAEATGHAAAYVPMLSDHVGALNGIDMEEEVRKGA